MKTVLITGSRGNLGSEYTKYLRRKNIRVFGVDLSNSEHKDDISVNSLKELKTFKHFSSISNIIHLSAVSGVSDGEKDPENCVRTNVYELSTLLHIISCNKLNIANFLFISSADAINIKKNYKSDQNIYGLTKFMGELIVKYYSKKLNFNIAILRFTTLYGFVNNSNKKVLPHFIKLAIQDKPIQIFNNDTFNFLHYKDAINALNFSLSNMSCNKKIVEEFNFFSSENITLIELANKIKIISKSKSKILRENVDIKSSNFYNFGNKPIDWQQKVSLNHGIRSMLKILKSDGITLAKKKHE